MSMTVTAPSLLGHQTPPCVWREEQGVSWIQGCSLISQILGQKRSQLKNWCYLTVVLEKTLKSPLDCKKIQPVHPKGDQSWVFIGRTDAEAETPILWPPDAKSWLIGKDPDAGKDWGQEEKGMTGWDDWMASLTQWTWVWVNSRSWWWTGRPGVLQSMGSQRVRYSWVTELSWTEPDMGREAEGAFFLYTKEWLSGLWRREWQGDLISQGWMPPPLGSSPAVKWNPEFELKQFGNPGTTLGETYINHCFILHCCSSKGTWRGMGQQWPAVVIGAVAATLLKSIYWDKFFWRLPVALPYSLQTLRQSHLRPDN